MPGAIGANVSSSSGSPPAGPPFEALEDSLANPSFDVVERSDEVEYGDQETPAWLHTVGMLRLRILAPSKLTDDVAQILDEDPSVSGLAVIRGAAVRPTGDLVLADITREAANDAIQRLRALGLHREGIEIQPVCTWLSSRGFDAELRAPGEQRGRGCVGRSRAALLRRKRTHLDLLELSDARDIDRRHRHRPWIRRS